MVDACERFETRVFFFFSFRFCFKKEKIGKKKKGKKKKIGKKKREGKTKPANTSWPQQLIDDT